MKGTTTISTLENERQARKAVATAVQQCAVGGRQLLSSMFLLLAAPFLRAESLPFDVGRLEDVGSPDPLYCATLLRGLKEGRDVAFLKPIAEFDALADITRDPPFGWCSLEYLVQDVEFQSWQWEAVKDRPFKEQWNNGLRSIKTEGFKIYEADVDAEHDGMEQILYGAGSRRAFGTWEDTVLGDRLDFTSFMIPDLQTCEPKYRIQVWDTRTYPGAVVGIVKHAGRVLFYDTHYWEAQQLHTLRFQTLVFRDDGRAYAKDVCRFEAAGPDR